MNVLEGANRQRARAVALHVHVVVLLDGDEVTINRRNPRDMPRLTGISLCNGPWHWLVVDLDADSASGLVPGVRVTPRGTLELVMKVDAEALVDAPCDETGALAREVEPAVFVAAGASAVWVVVLDFACVAGVAAASARVGGLGGLGRGGRGGDGGSVALGFDVLACAGLYVVVGEVAAVGGQVPDSVTIYAGAGGLAGYGHGVALGVGLLDGVVCARTSAAVDGVPSDGVGALRGVGWDGDIGGSSASGRDLGGGDLSGRDISRGDVRGSSVSGGDDIGGGGGGDGAVGGDASDDRDIDSATGQNRRRQ